MCPVVIGIYFNGTGVSFDVTVFLELKYDFLFLTGLALVLGSERTGE